MKDTAEVETKPRLALYKLCPTENEIGTQVRQT